MNYSDDRPACDNLTITVDMSRTVASQPRQGKKPSGPPRKVPTDQYLRTMDECRANPAPRLLLLG